MALCVGEFGLTISLRRHNYKFVVVITRIRHDSFRMLTACGCCPAQTPGMASQADTHDGVHIEALFLLLYTFHFTVQA